MQYTVNENRVDLYVYPHAFGWAEGYRSALNTEWMNKELPRHNYRYGLCPLPINTFSGATKSFSTNIFCYYTSADRI